MLAADILRDAADVIDQRATLRDTPGGERSMGKAVNAFNALVGGDRRLTEVEGWLFMCVLKMARSTSGLPHLDDWTDLAGYAALGGESITAPKPQDGFVQKSVDAADEPYVKPEPFVIYNPCSCKYPNPDTRGFCRNCN